MPVMQCRVCGRAVADGDRFCTACGTPLTGDTEPVDDDEGPDPDIAPTRPMSTVDQPADREAECQHIAVRYVGPFEGGSDQAREAPDDGGWLLGGIDRCRREGQPRAIPSRGHGRTRRTQ